MSKKANFVHPYIPNSAPKVKQEMLEAIGVKDVEELYEDIPKKLRFNGDLNIPEAIISEADLSRHLRKILSKNITTQEMTNFLGGTVANHYVPAICDEINSRAEFLTAYAGEPYEDYGRFHALYEYTSMMCELLDVDVVNVPTYDWNQAASTSLRMSLRITGRSKILLGEDVDPDRISTILNYCKSETEIVVLPLTAGRLDLDSLKTNLSPEVGAVYVETPGRSGIIENRLGEIADITHAAGALLVTGVDPLSLGLLKTPSQYGADITCGDLQSLGLHMFQGGAQAGFIGTRDEERFVSEYPSRLFSICPTIKDGELGFGDVLYDERTSFGAREKGKEYVGTASALWGITAAVYMALMGPHEINNLARHIMLKARYAKGKMNNIPGVSVENINDNHFKQFIVNFEDTDFTVESINKELLKNNIFGGHEITEKRALYCFTEMTTKSSIDKFCETLTKLLAV